VVQVRRWISKAFLHHLHHLVLTFSGFCQYLIADHQDGVTDSKTYSTLFVIDMRESSFGTVFLNFEVVNLSSFYIT